MCYVDELVIPAAKAKALKDGGYVGKTVVMGIRPEDVSDTPNGSMSSIHFCKVLCIDIISSFLKNKNPGKNPPGFKF